MRYVLYTLAILLLLLAIIFCLYVFVFIRPRKGKKADPRLFTDYAHRGLHGGNTPENSLEAFKKAVDSGYGIELDVQLSKDGEVMVFHDYTLQRVTGTEGNLKDLEKEELCKITLMNTEQRIPTFRQVLELVNGKVPLLVELKGEELDSSLCEKTAEILKEYNGPYCVESFNPLLVKNIKKYLPEVYCGQLYTNVCKEKKKYSPLNIILTLMAFNFLAKPDFIAYNKNYRNSFPVRLAVTLHRAPKFLWTVRSEEEFETAHRLGEYPIFENCTKA